MSPYLQGGIVDDDLLKKLIDSVKFGVFHTFCRLDTLRSDNEFMIERMRKLCPEAYNVGKLGSYEIKGGWHGMVSRCYQDGVEFREACEAVDEMFDRWEEILNKKILNANTVSSYLKSPL